MSLRATLFDMDGLLIDSEILWHEAELEIFGALGVPVSATNERSTKGLFVAEVVAHWYRLYPWSGPSVDDVVAFGQPGRRAGGDWYPHVVCRHACL